MKTRIRLVAGSTAIVALAVLSGLIFGAPTKSGADEAVQFTLDSSSYSAAVGHTFHVKVDPGDLNQQRLWPSRSVFPTTMTPCRSSATVPDNPNPCPWVLDDYEILNPDYNGLALRLKCEQLDGELLLRLRAGPSN